FYDGIAGFFLREEPRPNFLNYGVAALVVAMLAYYLYRDNDINLRVVWFNAFQLFIALRTAGRFVGHAVGKHRSVTLLMCTIFLGVAAASTWRIATVMWAPLMTNLLTQDTGYQVMILIAAMLAFSLSFCVLLLTHIRIEEDLEAARANAEHAALIDALTSLWNRRHFEAEALREIERANRYGQPASLVLFDIDHFKQVNDNFGHLAGDAVLRQIADIMRSTMRASDLICRWGGEEFAILLPTSMENALSATEKLRRAIDVATFPHGGKVTISAGCAQWGSGENLDAWSRRADQALYRAKANGRNRIESAQPAMLNIMAERRAPLTA
ncbi:MAG: GGDEF domain-containing protein, partial [Proteobacteria bacterium]|nr:GGDEF domain-containing protein [Pseudomonadota bacterium]